MTGRVNYYNSVGDTQGDVTTREHSAESCADRLADRRILGIFAALSGSRSEVLRAGRLGDLYRLETLEAYAKPDCQSLLSAQNSPRLASEGFERLKCGEFSDVGQLHVVVSGK